MQARTPEETQKIAQKHYAELLAGIPAEINNREERLPAELSLLNAKPLVKLIKILNSANTLYSYADKHIACRRGCAYCCHIAVDMSQIEADYIGQHTGIMPVKIRRPAQRDPTSFSSKTPCVFLKNGECSIYEYRPLACRVHVNLDSDSYWCQFENWRKPGAVIPKLTFHSITKAYAELNEKASAVMADIRDFFPSVSPRD